MKQGKTSYITLQNSSSYHKNGEKNGQAGEINNFAIDCTTFYNRKSEGEIQATHPFPGRAKLVFIKLACTLNGQICLNDVSKTGMILKKYAHSRQFHEDTNINMTGERRNLLLKISFKGDLYTWVYLKSGIRNPESGIKKKREFVDMKISTKVKVTWETVFIALEKL